MSAPQPGVLESVKEDPFALSDRLQARCQDDRTNVQRLSGPLYASVGVKQIDDALGLRQVCASFWVRVDLYAGRQRNDN
jgi:hypothetical protein